MAELEPTETRYQSVEDLSGECREALLQFGLAWADTKYILGVRISQWATGAPALEASVAASAITQEEFGHARLLYALLKDLSPSFAGLEAGGDRRRQHFYHPSVLLRPWNSWLTVITALILLDEALTLIFESARQSQYGPLRQRVSKVLQEEQFHRLFSHSWLQQLARSGNGVRRALQESIDAMSPMVEAWFGPPSQAALNTLVRTEILARDAVQMRQLWRHGVGRLLRDVRLRVSPAQLDWSRWEEATREVK